MLKIIKTQEKLISPMRILPFRFMYAKLQKPSFISIRKPGKYNQYELLQVIVRGWGSIGIAEILGVTERKLKDISTKILCQATGCKHRASAIGLIKYLLFKQVPGLNDETNLQIIVYNWYNGGVVSE